MKRILILAILLMSSLAWAGSTTVVVGQGAGGGEIDFTGSVAKINPTTQNGSQSVTVPSGASAAILVFSAYASGIQKLSSASLGSASFSVIAQKDSSGNSDVDNLEAWVAISPTAGSQTFSWAFDQETIDYNTALMIFFVKNTDTISPIRDYATGENYSAPPATATTGSFDTSSDDLVIVVGYGYRSNSLDMSPTGSGQTDYDSYNPGGELGGIVGVGYKAGSGSTTTGTMVGDYPMVIGFSLE